VVMLLVIWGLVMLLVIWGLLWSWHYIRRYRLAVAFAGLTVGFAIIRFISLHEIDAWNADAPWARTVIDVVATAGDRQWPSPGSGS
jgi:hypothetical protein